MNGVVGTHFRVGKKIGEGSFGVVFEGALTVISWRSHELTTAIKASI